MKPLEAKNKELIIIWVLLIVILMVGWSFISSNWKELKNQPYYPSRSE